jgi:cell wall-associated NlpC family hydrolase
MKKIITISLCLLSSYCFGQRPKRVDSIVQVIIIPATKNKVVATVDTTPKVNKLDTFVNAWKGKPYVFGGTSKKGIDCSAFVQRLYQEVFNIIIPRTALSQYKAAIKIPVNEMSIGDLLFFLSPSSPSGWHVAIYLGNDIIIHAANRKRGVVIDELTRSLMKSIYAVGHFNKEKILFFNK